MKYYFIDKEIYFKGKKQPPRKVECYNLEYRGDIAHFNDEDGNFYSIPKNEIIEEK